MAGFLGLEQREVVRVKVKKYEGFMQPECKRFSLDPQITSFEMLQHIIANAFNVKGDFTMSYLAHDDEGQEIYLSMLSDWDMDAAFQSASDPYLQLKVDTKPFEEGLDDWDIIAPLDVPQHRITSLVDRNTLLGSLTGTISSGVGKTFTHMQRAMGIKVEDESRYKPSKSPMSDMEFRHYLDSAGHMIKPEEFRLSIYQGGAEPSLRRVTWRHLLNIFPTGMSGKERFDFMKRKENEYYQLRDQWKQQIQCGQITEEIKYVTSMVKKDVLRTDRTHKFYSGSDDNKNLLALFHMLVTYALTHPQTSYCQGMSDIASPLLVIQKDEAQAYLCLCGLMKRMKDNFNINGAAITKKFKHLSDLLNLHDPVLFNYLQEINAHDLFFCYRWLLLELKREFPFDESLYMLEVMWSTLPPDPPEFDLLLTDPDYSPILFSTSPCSPSFSMKQTVYAKLISLRRSRTMSKTIPKNADDSKEKEIASGSVNNNSRLPENVETSHIDIQEFPCMDDAETKAVIRQSSLIDKTLEVNHSYNESEASLSSSDIAQSSSKIVKNTFVGNSDVDVTEVENEEYPEENEGKDLITSGSDGKEREEADTLSDHEEVDSQTGNIGCKSDACDVSDENKVDEGIDVLDDEKEIEDDSTESQFHISIESTEGTDSKEKTEGGNGGNEGGNEGEQQFTGFFQNVKRLLSSPRKRPTDISIPVRHEMQPKPEVQVPSVKSSKEKSSTSEETIGKHKPMLKINGHMLDCTENISSSLEKPDIKTGNEGSNDESVKEKDAVDTMNCLELSNSENSLEIVKCDVTVRLPEPHEFGGGNPFLMFLCLTLLLQHRDLILQNRLEYDEIAIMFDKLVRKHNVHKVLHQARNLYSEYLRSQQKLVQAEESDLNV